MRAATLILLAACATEARELLTDLEARDLATSIASTLRPVTGGGELGAMLDAVALVRGEERAEPHLGFPHHYVVACRDAGNRAIACGLHTDNADVDATWYGLLATPALLAVAAREGRWILNDVTPERLRLDGDSHFEYASASAVTGETHALSYDASYRNIVHVRGERWPRAGLVRYELVRDRTYEDAIAVRADARFRAGGRATIVLPDHAYELDLTTGALRSAQ